MTMAHNEIKFLVFESKLRDVFEKLTSTEQKIARYVLDNPLEVVHATSEQLAKATGVSTATVIRFAQSCGFSGLTDLKISLRREVEIAKDPAMLSGVKPDDTTAMIKRKVMGYHNLVINSMLSNWNEAAYQMAVDELLKARRILIIGEGGSRSSAICLLDICTQLNLQCEVCNDSVFEIMKVGNMDSRDVIVGMSYTGRLRNTIDSLKLARSRDITTIGFVGVMDSPIIPYVDILLNTNMMEKEYYSSALSVRVSELAVIEVLYTMLSVRLGKFSENNSVSNEFVDIRRV